MKRAPATPFVLCWLVLSCGGLAAQKDEPPAAAKPTLRAWPKLERLQADRVDQLLKNFRLDNPELHAKSQAELVEMGAGAAPLLIARLSDAKSNVNAPILHVLAQVTTCDHAGLVAKEADSKVVARRQWAVGRLAEFQGIEAPAKPYAGGLAGALPDLAAVLGKAAGDADEEVAYRAAAGLAALGDVRGLDKVLARVKADWAGARGWLETVLRGGRNAAASAWLVERVRSGPDAEKPAALRLFRSLGVREDAGKIATLLDSSDNNTKKEAINALRVVVLGEPALDDLSVFQAIEMAKQIKSKL